MFLEEDLKIPVNLLRRDGKRIKSLPIIINKTNAVATTHPNISLPVS
jgi:hypothetical protein